MKQGFFFFRNQDGSVTVISLMVLAILTIMGFSASNVADTELGITRNEAIYRRIFYRAEAAGIEACQRLEIEQNRDTLLNLTPIWLNDDSTNMTVPGNWNLSNSTVTLIDPNARFSVVMRTDPRGASLDATATTRLYNFSVYGLYNGPDGMSEVDIGYKKRI